MTPSYTTKHLIDCSKIVLKEHSFNQPYLEAIELHDNLKKNKTRGKEMEHEYKVKENSSS